MDADKGRQRKLSRNFYLSREALELLREISARLGISQASVLEMLVREKANGLGLVDRAVPE